ncbi:hypothetical protein FOWG_17650 [Fusarium oxysporum f. sp. lycopersici MN25]|nr:hypothetical protein FOWG_17650 [Fusarium oxysporum f. sp. lycopersici MN25]
MAGYDASLASYNSPEGIKSHHSPKTDTHLRPQYTKPKPKFYQPESAHPQKSKTPLHKMKRPKRDHKNPQSRPNPKPEQESHHKSHNVIPHQSQSIVHPGEEFSAWAYADYTLCLSSSVLAMGSEADVNLTGTSVMVTLD